MEMICELNDKIILGTDEISEKAPRITARALVRDRDGLYAVMYAKKFNLYPCPATVWRKGRMC